MQNFEIRICGSAEKFQGLTSARLRSGIPSLWTPEEIEHMGLKCFQDWNVSIFYSVFFGRNSYMLCCHFLAPIEIATAKNNHRMTTIALIVRRGYKIENALTNLKSVYFNLVSFIERNRNSDVKGFQKVLLAKVEEQEEAVAAELVKDDDQHHVNSERYENRGYVSYTTEEQLSDYFAEPLRIDFKGACQILFLQSKMLRKVSAALSEQKFLAVQSEPKYLKRYALYFPDFNPNQPILLIQSLNEEITHTFNRPGYKAITLSGRLSDHMIDWKIERSADKTSYSIGLRFKSDKGGSMRKFFSYIFVFALGLLLGRILFGNYHKNDIPYNYGVEDTCIDTTDYGDTAHADCDTVRNSDSNVKLSDVIDMQKLDGIEYTYEDLKKAIGKAETVGIYDENKEYFYDRRFALLVVCQRAEKEANHVSPQIHHGLETLSAQQRSALMAIIKDEKIYNSDSNAYPTIKAMKENILQVSRTRNLSQKSNSGNTDKIIYLPEKTGKYGLKEK